MEYRCSNPSCKSVVGTIYSSVNQSGGICESCWELEDPNYAQKVKTSLTQLKHNKKRDSQKYTQLNSIRDTYSPRKKKHYGVPPPIDI